MKGCSTITLYLCEAKKFPSKILQQNLAVDSLGEVEGHHELPSLEDLS